MILPEKTGRKMGAEEAEPLYARSSEDDELESFQEKNVRSSRSNRLLLYILGALGYIILLGLYTRLWIRFRELEAEVHQLRPELFPSLAESSAFRRDSRVFSLTVADTPFAGDPSPELDKAWHDLLEDTTIRVAKEDLDYYNVTSLPLADGSGYASELFMTHELHCLKKVRQWIYKDAYFDDVQGLARNELKRHGIMCRGDVSLGTYTYISAGTSVTARSWGSHQCVDFDALISWARERAVDIFQPGAIPSPEEVGPEHITLKKEPH
ncbi:hypothetical protein UA08_01851 [Talaromyces atroroseus]|uniref:Uncharacterized protein n=1 Tax=Talaromyces atroroseus TaxID=1441469 RepID=A0A1Q5QA56_TALAT|nr:hypothetical protein UA08_01851 [Talaromyces atroroseus]OKL62771.1 hypothetical protein UA08_01851 [Talaromyces atroroseus]